MLKPSELFFLLSGLGFLFSLPFLAGGTTELLLLAKVFYFTGLIFFIRDIVKNGNVGD